MTPPPPVTLIENDSCNVHHKPYSSYCPTCKVLLCLECFASHNPLHYSLFLNIPPLISKHYIVKRMLGKGSFGYVFLIKNKVNSVESACKIFQIPKNNYDGSMALNTENNTEIPDIFKELKFQSKMKEKHVNIVNSLDAFEDENELYKYYILFMEYCD